MVQEGDICVMPFPNGKLSPIFRIQKLMRSVSLESLECNSARVTVVFIL